MTTPSRTGFAELDASGGNLSASATVPAGTNLVVAFWSHWDGNAGSSVSSITINGVAMTIQSQLAEGADEPGVGVATLVSPATGPQTHALTWSAGGARTEGGEVVFVYYQDGNTSDPVRASGTNAATVTNEAAVGLANTETTDRVVGFVQNFQDGNDPAPVITGVTAFINNTTLNLHEYDVGDTTGVSGTVTVSNSDRYYTATAAISLKESAGGAAFIKLVGNNFRLAGAGGLAS